MRRNDKVLRRVQVTTPFGTKHWVTVETPRDFKFTPEIADRFARQLLIDGVISVDPVDVKRNVLQALSGLPPEERAAWYNTLRAASTVQAPSKSPAVAVEFSREDFFGEAHGDSSGGLVTPVPFASSEEAPFKVNLTPERLQALLKSAYNVKVDMIVDQVDVTPNAPTNTLVLYPRAKETKRIESEYVSPAIAAAARHGVPADIFLALISSESAWNPNAVSSKGAIGLGQLMPETAKALGVNPRNPLQNLEGAARYLRQQYDKFGDWDKALAAYNAGPNRVAKGRIPSSTQAYIRKIHSLAPSMPVDGSSPGALRAKARLMAEQQLQYTPDLSPDQNAAIVNARLIAGGYTAPVGGESISDYDYWSFIGRTLTLEHINLRDPKVRTNTVLEYLKGNSPAVAEMIEGGFSFSFEQEKALTEGSVAGISPELFNTLLAPTDSRLFNLGLTAVTVGRALVPARGAIAGARAAQGGVLSRAGAALLGAVSAEVKTLGAFDALYGITQLAPSLVLNGTLTKDDLIAAASQFVPFYNIVAPGIGEAFKRNGIEGQIDWSGWPSWLKPIAEAISPRFEDVDRIVMLPLMGLGIKTSQFWSDFRAKIAGRKAASARVVHSLEEPGSEGAAQAISEGKLPPGEAAQELVAAGIEPQKAAEAVESLVEGAPVHKVEVDGELVDSPFVDVREAAARAGVELDEAQFQQRLEARLNPPQEEGATTQKDVEEPVVEELEVLPPEDSVTAAEDRVDGVESLFYNTAPGMSAYKPTGESVSHRGKEDIKRGLLPAHWAERELVDAGASPETARRVVGELTEESYAKHHVGFGDNAEVPLVEFVDMREASRRAGVEWSLEDFVSRERAKLDSAKGADTAPKGESRNEREAQKAEKRLQEALARVNEVLAEHGLRMEIRRDGSAAVIDSEGQTVTSAKGGTPLESVIKAATKLRHRRGKIGTSARDAALGKAGGKQPKGATEKQGGGKVEIGVDGGDLTMRVDVEVAGVPRYNVKTDTPEDLLPEGLKPGEMRKTKDGRVYVLASKEALGIPFGYKYLPDDAPRSALEINARSIHERGEGVIYTNDPSAGRLKGATDGYVAAAEGRVRPDGSVEAIPIVYHVKGDGRRVEVYSATEVYNNPVLLERAAKAAGFDDIGAFVEALRGDSPVIRNLNPVEGQREIIGGKRKSALEEDGFFIFVDDFVYRTEVQRTGNEVVDGAVDMLEYIRVNRLDPRSPEALRAAAEAVGAPKESIRYLETADTISFLPDGTVVTRHNPNPEVLDPDVLAVIHEGLVIDAGTAVTMGKDLSGGRESSMTQKEAEATMKDAMNSRSKRCP